MICGLIMRGHTDIKKELNTRKKNLRSVIKYYLLNHVIILNCDIVLNANCDMCFCSLNIDEC